MSIIDSPYESIVINLTDDTVTITAVNEIYVIEDETVDSIVCPQVEETIVCEQIEEVLDFNIDEVVFLNGGQCCATKVIGNITTETIVDSVLIDDVYAVKWMIYALTQDGTKQRYVEVTAAHNGVMSDATEAKFHIIGIMRYGSINGLSFNVGITGSGENQAMELRISSIDIIDVHLNKSEVKTKDTTI